MGFKFRYQRYKINAMAAKGTTKARAILIKMKYDNIVTKNVTGNIKFEDGKIFPRLGIRI